MKTFLACCLVIILGFIPEVQAQEYSFSVCSGQNQRLEITEFLPGSVFEWFADNLKLTENSNVLTVKEITASSVIKHYRCDQKKNGIIYKTASFVVTFNPYTAVDIIPGSLCEGKMTGFSMSNPAGISAQTWNIGNKEYYGKSVDVLCTSAPIKVNLVVVNQYGCSTEIEKTFNVTKKPEMDVEEIPLTKNFINGVHCGNSISEFELKGLSGSFKLLRWNFAVTNRFSISVSALSSGKVIPGDKSLFEWVLIDGNKIRVKWVKTNTSSNVLVSAMTSNGVCEYDAGLFTILINDNSPDVDSVYQKPVNSNILIYPSGQFQNSLKYEWGYTDPSGKEFTYVKSSSFYCEYPGLNPTNKYWVETWYTTNEICRTRNLINKVAKSATISNQIIEVYPNPVVDNLHLKLENPLEGKITISDLSGVVFKIVPVNPTTELITLGVGSIPSGVYLLRYTSDTGHLVLTESFMKQ